MGFWSKVKSKAKEAVTTVKRNTSKVTDSRAGKVIKVAASTYAETYGGPYGLVASSIAHSGGDPRKAFSYGKDRVVERVEAGKKFFTGDWKGLAGDVATNFSARTGGSAEEQARLRKAVGLAATAKTAYDTVQSAGGPSGLVNRYANRRPRIPAQLPRELAGPGASGFAGLVNSIFPGAMGETASRIASGSAGRSVAGPAGARGSSTMPIILAGGAVLLLAVAAIRR